MAIKARWRAAIVWSMLLTGLAVALLPLPLVGAAHGQPQATPATVAEPPPEQVNALLKLLADPNVQAWLRRQTAARTGEPGSAFSEAELERSIHGLVGERLAAIRANIISQIEAVPGLPGDFGKAWVTLNDELAGKGVLSLLLLIGLFAGLGFGAERVYWAITPTVRSKIVDAPSDTVRERLTRIGLRLAFGVGWVMAFAIGSIGAFLLFEWPPRLQEIVLGYLLVFLVIRLALVVGRVLYSPLNGRLRIVPMPDEAALFWQKWLTILVGWVVFGRVTADLLQSLGFGLGQRRIVGHGGGLVVLALFVWVLWRRPVVDTRTGGVTTAAESRRASAWLWTGYFIVLWLLFAIGAIGLFALWIVGAALPSLVRISDRTVAFVLRPPGQTADETRAAVPSITAACLDRGARFVLIAGAGLFLAWALGADFTALTAGDTILTRLLRQALNAVIIVLALDFLWHLLKTWIDREIVSNRELGPPDSDRAYRKARLHTLLPILRNVLFVVLLTMAVLMILASLGVEIGPLIASAGVVGLAVGFGAQTLVKDVIAGVFYLLDDAFRVGEYIQSGNYKGTVESFSLRSVKLRHHRGPLYTVPFGALGAIQNMSRDWVIDKIGVGVTYDTDLDKLKNVVKQVSAEIMQDPELARNIIEPLKSQGVDQMGDFAIQIRMKIKTKPGEQFTIRRQIYAKIKKAFDANGIKFAFPTVQVAGGHGGDSDAAMARQALEMRKPTDKSA